jgi:hypothetical protein
MNSKTGHAYVKLVYTECNRWSTLWLEYLCRAEFMVTEETGDEDAIQLEVRAVREKDRNN